MKLLTWDIETFPNLGYHWGLFDQNIALNQLVAPGHVVAVSAKWYHEPKTMFFSEYHNGYEPMLRSIYDLIDEADALVSYNGVSFDTPWVNGEFWKLGWAPPAPAAQIDLLRVVRKNFRLPSNKLQYVSQHVGLEGKVQHTGFQLWKDCIAGDEKAWRLMRKYSVQDTNLTEKLYERLIPWIGGHPNPALYEISEHLLCTRCGSDELRPRGFAYTAMSRFQRYRCDSCGAWSRDTKRDHGVSVRDAR